MTQVEIICARHKVGTCGFRVHARYAVEKNRKFAPGICPRCAAPTIIVEKGTDTIAVGWTQILDSSDKSAYGGLVPPQPSGGAAYMTSVAAATAVLGYNLLINSEARQSTRRRKLVAAGLAGSAAGGDTEVEIKAGNRTLAWLFNLATGFPNRDSMSRVGEWVGPNEELQAFVRDAPATNPINLALDFA